MGDIFVGKSDGFFSFEVRENRSPLSAFRKRFVYHFEALKHIFLSFDSCIESFASFIYLRSIGILNWDVVFLKCVPFREHSINQNHWRIETFNNLYSKKNYEDNLSFAFSPQIILVNLHKSCISAERVI